MRKVTLVSCAALTMILATMSFGAQASSMDDREWWGADDAKPGPVRDAERSGYWWWPTAPQSSSAESEAWGNRGVVYSLYSPPAPPAPPRQVRATPPPPPPPPAPAPVPQRSVPVFSEVLFDFDGSTVGDGGKAAIAKIVEVLMEYSDDSITVEGHTDNVNGSGDPDYNTKLGQRRSDAVMAIMVDQGIAARRIDSVSYGDKRPASSNDSSDTRALNRRVVFVYDISN